MPSAKRAAKALGGAAPGKLWLPPGVADDAPDVSRAQKLILDGIEPTPGPRKAMTESPVEANVNATPAPDANDASMYDKIAGMAKSTASGIGAGARYLGNGMKAADKAIMSGLAPKAWTAGRKILQYGVPGSLLGYGGWGLVNYGRARLAESQRPDDPYSAGEEEPRQARAPMNAEQMAEARAKVLARLRGQQ